MERNGKGWTSHGLGSCILELFRILERSTCSRAPAAPLGNAGHASELIPTSTSLEKHSGAGRGWGLFTVQPREAEPSRGGIFTPFPFYQ